jgi:integrase
MDNRFKFTKSSVAAAHIPALNEPRTTCYDTEIPKLAVRVTAAGRRTFYVIKRASGEMVWLKLGVFPDMTVEQARKEATKALGAFADGQNPAAARRALKQEPTFAQLFTDYLDRHAKQHKRTWREDKQKYHDYLEAALARKKISRITRQDLASIHSRITRDGHPTVANRVKDLFSSVFGRAIEWGLLESNPAKGIRDNPERSRDRFLQRDELPRLFAALAEEPNQTFRDYFLLALLTGARRANVRAMRWGDLDLDRGEWRIPLTKNGQPQNVPLVPEAVVLLESRKEAAGDNAAFVFPAARQDSKHGHMSGERKAWLRLLDRDELAQLRRGIEASGHELGPISATESPSSALAVARAKAKRLKLNTEGARLTDVRIHDLRRTLGSWQARTGASLVIIGKSLGHKSQQATAVYARLDTDPVRQAMQTATSAILQAAGVKASASVEKMTGRA